MKTFLYFILLTIATGSCQIGSRSVSSDLFQNGTDERADAFLASRSLHSMIAVTIDTEVNPEEIRVPLYKDPCKSHEVKSEGVSASAADSKDFNRYFQTDCATIPANTHYAGYTWYNNGTYFMGDSPQSIWVNLPTLLKNNRHAEGHVIITTVEEIMVSPGGHKVRCLVERDDTLQ